MPPTRRTPIQHFGRRSRLSPKVQRNNFLLLSSPLTTAIGPTRTSDDVRFRAAVRGIADIKRALISQRPDFTSWRLSCDLILLVLAAHHDLERIIRQRSLQGLRLIPWRASKRPPCASESPRNV